MPVCSPGISQTRPQVAQSIIVDAAYVQSLLPPVLAWLYPYLPFMHGLEIGSVSAFCAVDPPTVLSVPSAAEFYGFLTGGPIGYLTTVENFIESVTRYYLWYKTCECTAGVFVTPSTSLTPPAGLPAVNPPSTSLPPLALACLDTQQDNWPNEAAVRDSSGNSSSGMNVTDIVTDWQLVNDTSSGATRYSITPNYYSENPLTFVSSGTGLTTSGVNTEFHHGAFPAGATLVSFRKVMSFHPAGQGAGLTLRVRFLCDGATLTQRDTACCPPDPTLSARLTRLDQTLTLLQRQLAPFAYISGTAHHSLTGTGTIAVQGILGALLNVSVPASYGTAFGTPDKRFGVGVLRWGTSDGYAAAIAIDTVDQVVFPESASLYTLIGYTLEPGVSMTLTELVREP